MTPPENTPDTDDAVETKDIEAVPSDTETSTEELTDSTATDVEPSDTEAVDAETAESVPAAPVEPKPGINWPRTLAFVVLPVLALILGGVAGFLKWQDSSVRNADLVRIESVQVAKDATVRLLSYKPDTVEQDLNSARDLLTGEFRDSYTQLINDVVIPGSKEKQIAAVATVPAAASVSAEPNRAVVLVFVNQTVVVGTDAPTATTSSVQVTMERDGDGWLISEFDPV
ncbi:hypothetical protein BH10ACT9_BH10ACT9_51430 [soil metagenome]